MYHEPCRLPDPTKPWIADETQLAVARRVLPQLTETMDQLWRNFEHVGYHHPSEPFTSVDFIGEGWQMIWAYLRHSVRGPRGNIILRSPLCYPIEERKDPPGWKDLPPPYTTLGERWAPVEPKDVIVAKIVFRNIEWGVDSKQCDIAGILPLLLAFRNTRHVAWMEQLKLSHCIICDEESVHALGVVLALKPINELSLESVQLKNLKSKGLQLHSKGWRALTRLEITDTPAGLVLLESLQHPNSYLAHLLYQVSSEDEIWRGELKRVLSGFNYLARAEIQVPWRLIDPTVVGAHVPNLACGEYLLREGHGPAGSPVSSRITDH